LNLNKFCTGKQKDKINTKVDVVQMNNGIFENVRDKRFSKYELTFKMKEDWNIHTNFFISLGFQLHENVWKMTVE
jgi:hypothetical protein